MIVLAVILLVFLLNLSFMILESRNRVWQKGRFWALVIGVGIVLGGVIYNNIHVILGSA
jgi:hypothetical protein